MRTYYEIRLFFSNVRTFRDLEFEARCAAEAFTLSREIAWRERADHYNFNRKQHG